MTLSLIALGSNLGDRLAHLRSAVAALNTEPGISVTATSGLYETAPVGGPDNQGPFFNAAAALETNLAAADLLATLHRIEAGRDRERVVHWGPRTLDLDLLTHGEMVSDETALTVPHPRMHLRCFVMVPVCDIAADMIHPRLGEPMRTHLARLATEPGDLTLVSADWATAA